MDKGQKQAGFYVLEKFELRPLYEPKEYPVMDIKRAVVNWQITESVTAPFISGSAVVAESWDLLAKMPLRGEESLTIEFKDFFDNVYSYTFYVYAITGIEKDTKTNGKLMKYIINFCSFPKLQSDYRFVRKSYGNLRIDEMVQDLYDNYFQGKPIEIESTYGKQTLVIPRLRPDEAMQFLSRRSWSNDRQSSLYYFFENRDQYYFSTYEYLVDKAKPKVETADAAAANNLKYIFSTFEDNSPGGQKVAQFSVSDLSYNDRSNSIKAMKDGAYKRRITELDYYNRTRTVTNYDYASNLSSYEHIDDLKLINTNAYIETYMPDEEAPEVVYVTDYNQQALPQGKDFSMRLYPNYSENMLRKTMAAYHLGNSAVSCTINGNGEIKAGDMIFLEVYKFSENSGKTVQDNERTGRYLVLSVVNIFSGDYYKQKLTITKGGLGDD